MPAGLTNSYGYERPLLQAGGGEGGDGSGAVGEGGGPGGGGGEPVLYGQGLTLVHFSAQRKPFLWDRGCI